MHPDQSIAKAYEALHAAYRFDAFGKVPHPDNLKFRSEVEDRFMRRLGMLLVHMAEGEDQQWVGWTVQRYFGTKLNHPPSAGEVQELPRFLLSPDDPA